MKMTVMMEIAGQTPCWSLLYVMSFSSHQNSEVDNIFSRLMEEDIEVRESKRQPGIPPQLV